jgi:hypothetical protein
MSGNDELFFRSEDGWPCFEDGIYYDMRDVLRKLYALHNEV